MTDHRPALPPSIEAGLAGLDEGVWMDVIQKMDEVYNDLLQYEVALEEKNAALEDSRNFIFSVLSSMSDILIVCNRSGVIEEVNPPLEKFTGLAEQELKGQSLPALFADEDSRQKASRMIARHADHAHDCELMLRAADGTPVPVSLNCTPRLNAVGKAQGFVITGRPVGELRRAYQALGHAHEELKRAQRQLIQSEKMASLGRLVAGVAHELNNPISFVLGNVHALQRYAERLRSYIEAFHGGTGGDALARMRRDLRIDRILADLPSLTEGTIEGAERTRDIVDGLKRFSALDRSDGGRFNLADVLERAVHWVAKASPTDFLVHRRWPEDIPVEGSAGQLQQVVMNLVENARDATAGRDRPALTVSGHVGTGQVHLSFHDDGPGIAAADLPHIFDPFFTTKPVGQGTGLGLAISYSIVERHGGKLAAANHPDGGAVFTLSLPLAENKPATGGTQAESA